MKHVFLLITKYKFIDINLVYILFQEIDNNNYIFIACLIQNNYFNFQLKLKI